MTERTESCSDDKGHLTVDEVRRALEAMTDIQLKILRLWTRWLTQGTRMDADDLISKAVVSALSTRECPRDVSVMVFLRGAIRSLADAEYKSMDRSNVVAFPRGRDGDDDPLSQVADESPDPETVLLLAEQRTSDELMVNKINAVLENDFDAQLLLAGWSEGLKGKDLRELVDKDQAGLDYLAKRVARTIRRCFPNGWSR
jgi:DNA-directed RNA polymerase specialized sigma24 family protein